MFRRPFNEMVRLFDIPTASAIIVAVSVVIGLGFTLLELRHLARTRRTDVIMRIYDRFGSREMVEAINSVGRLKAQDVEFPPKTGLTGVTQVAIVFEGLGVLLEQDLIDIELVNSLFRSDPRQPLGACSANNTGHEEITKPTVLLLSL